MNSYDLWVAEVQVKFSGAEVVEIDHADVMHPNHWVSYAVLGDDVVGEFDHPTQTGEIQ